MADQNQTQSSGSNLTSDATPDHIYYYEPHFDSLYNVQPGIYHRPYFHFGPHWAIPQDPHFGPHWAIPQDPHFSPHWTIPQDPHFGPHWAIPQYPVVHGYYPAATNFVGQYFGPHVYPQAPTFQQDLASPAYDDSSRTTQNDLHANDSNVVTPTQTIPENAANGVAPTPTIPENAANGVAPTPTIPENGANDGVAPALAIPEDEATITICDPYVLSSSYNQYDHAFFFAVRSSSRENVHYSINNSVWSCSYRANRRLNAAYRKAQELASNQRRGFCPVFLFFWVKHSFQFCGVAQMKGPVDSEKTLNFPHHNDWKESFPIEWLMFKDLPFPNVDSSLISRVMHRRHIFKINFTQGAALLDIFKSYESQSSVLHEIECMKDKKRR